IYEERDMELELIRMKYAFEIKLVEEVIAADEVILKEEQDYFEHFFPADLIRNLGLDDPLVLNECYKKAVVELPNRLTMEERLSIFGLLLGASVADDFLEFREFGVLEAAAKVLAIPAETMMDFIDSIFQKN
ncbi:MAG: hypothetical protein VX278_13875, partial [Myxococcota bacterium]|nr:hypothetical protein [Myxococcota bacterium]